MILGLGTDIVDLRGFREQVADPASTFVRGTFTEGERRDAGNRSSGDPAQHLAVRFAAKEAFVKAWSGGNFGQAPAMKRADLLEVEVIVDAFARPALRLHGDVAAAFAQSVGPSRLHLSLSHDGDYATATVVIEQRAS